MIVAVTGPAGSGKTRWIREQIAKDPQPRCYFTPDMDGACIDRTCLATEFPELHIRTRGQEAELWALAESGFNVYIELPWYWELSSLEPLLNHLNCRRIAVVPQNDENAQIREWADRIIVGHQGVEMIPELPDDELQIHRGLLTGEIVDWTSLTVFWFELIGGAYGRVKRAKGIFEIASGESIYGDFVSGIANSEFLALDLPKHLEGRPQRFSGFEIVGRDLERSQISATLKDCCLPDSHIQHYQQQLQDSVAEEREVLI